VASGGGLFNKLMVQPFAAGDRTRSRAWDIILWWEFRRIPYNLIVGSAGVVSGIISFTAAGISESKGGEPVGMPDGIFLIAAPILFGIAANMCYTGGWFVELFVRGLLRRDLRRFAHVAFVWGVVFSIAVTFLPAVLAVAYLIGLLGGVVHPAPGTGR
jgi:hypothetical protein